MLLVSHLDDPLRNGLPIGPYPSAQTGNTAAAPWLFSGLLRRGERLSNGGIELDMMAPSSPRGTTLVAEIPNLLGPGVSAHMTYYETPSGAKVFAAGAFTLAGSAWQPDVSRLLENLWARLARER